MRKILVVVGSGVRNGNTDQLAQAFIKGASEQGHQVSYMFLGDGVIQGCTGCGACQLGTGCVLQDHMQNSYSLFEEADTIILASPLYFWTISATLKAWIERLYAISKNDRYPAKDCVLLMSAGDDRFWTFEQAVSYYRFVTKALGWNDLGMYLAGGCIGEAGKREIKEEHLQHVYALGRNISIRGEQIDENKQI